jgi:SRSO17 transposase
MANQERKSVEPIALRFAENPQGGIPAENEVVALQGFLRDSPWEAGDVFCEIQAVFTEELVPSAAGSPIGTVGVIDESGVAKSGDQSVGAAVQWCGRLGKTANCQVGVHLIGVTAAGFAALDAQLFLPEGWIGDTERREKTRVPETVKFQTKPQIAAELLRRTREAGKVRFDWIIADEVYGDSGDLMDDLEAARQQYVLEVRSNTLVCTVDPATLPGSSPGPKRRRKLGSYRYREIRSVREIVADLSAEAWQPLKLRDGSKGPLVFEYVALRVWAMRHGRPGPPIWLLFRRSLAKKPQTWYYLSNAGDDTPWEHMALVTGARIRVEEYFEDAKMHLGMAACESRAWSSWHHHMALVALAHLYVTLAKRELNRNTPELTLDMALSLLQSAFACKTLSMEHAEHLVEYHLRRNKIAHDSHEKAWLAEHEALAKRLKL